MAHCCTSVHVCVMLSIYLFIVVVVIVKAMLESWSLSVCFSPLYEFYFVVSSYFWLSPWINYTKSSDLSLLFTSIIFPHTLSPWGAFLLALSSWEGINLYKETFLAGMLLACIRHAWTISNEFTCMMPRKIFMIACITGIACIILILVNEDCEKSTFQGDAHVKRDVWRYKKW